jgi:hypothetical protein
MSEYSSGDWAAAKDAEEKRKQRTRAIRVEVVCTGIASMSARMSGREDPTTPARREWVPERSWATFAQVGQAPGVWPGIVTRQCIGYSLCRSDRLKGIASEQANKGLYEKLMAQKIIVALRGSRIRVSPNFFNTEDDIDSFLKLL